MDNRLRYGTFLAFTALASAQCGAEDYFLRARPPVDSLYTYAGVDFHESDDGTTTTLGIPLEARYVTTTDWQFALQGAVVHDDQDNTKSLDTGDTVVTIGRGRRGLWRSDFAIAEIGYIFDGARPGFESGDEYFVRGRIQGGWTRLGLDASIMLSSPTRSRDSARPAATVALGYRGQFGRYHLGADLITRLREGNDTDDTDDTDPSWASLVVMKRNAAGGACYGIVRKRLSSDSDDWYVGIGYEVRFEIDALFVR
jgi:hypothetical protein